MATALTLEHYAARAARETYWLIDPALAASYVAVTPRLGFPYVLDTITLWQRGDDITDYKLSIVISDDGETDTGFPLRGSPVYAWTGSHVGGEPDTIRMPNERPVTLEPRVVVPRAGTYIKVGWFLAVIGPQRVVVLTLIPLATD